MKTPREQIIEQFIQPVVDETGVSFSTMRGTSRQGRIVAARYKAMLNVKQGTGWPNIKIGQMFNRDRTVVNNALKRETTPRNYSKLQGVRRPYYDYCVELIKAGLDAYAIAGKLKEAYPDYKCFYNYARNVAFREGLKIAHCTGRRAWKKLNDRDVRMVKIAREADMTINEIAEACGVSEACIYKVCEGQSHQHTPDLEIAGSFIRV